MTFGNGKSCVLVIGGTSGLGAELAQRYVQCGEHQVVVTGRADRNQAGVIFRRLSIDSNHAYMHSQMTTLLCDIPSVHALIYAAGSRQMGRIDQLGGSAADEMVAISLLAPIMLVRMILDQHKVLPLLTVITSTSAYTPRELEPFYTATKAGLGMLANSLSLDPRFLKTLVVAPGGMNTRFWNGSDMDRSTLLDPAWVADQIMEQSRDAFKYKFIKIPREPREVQVAEIRCVPPQ